MNTLILSALLCAPLPAQNPPVVLVVLMDDVGASDTPASLMPELDSIRQAGVNFTRAYAHSWCSPTRDSLLFGSWPGAFRGDLCVGYQPNLSHAAGEPSVMRQLEDDGWGTWMVGKWHQGNAPRSGIGWEEGPLYWWQHWLMGTAYSSNATNAAECLNPSLWMYPTSASPSVVVNDGFVSTDTRYDLVREREALLDAIAQALLTPEPDLIYFAPQAAHAPWQTPPAWMLPPGYVTPLNATDRDYYEEELRALDFVIGEAVAAIGPSAWVAIMGDNGTPCAVDVDNLRGCKLSPYEGGIRVPLVLHGPGLSPGSIADPVHVMDVVPTILDGVSLDSSWHSGSELFSGRGWVACWRGANVPDKAIVESRYKLIRFASGSEEMYDLLLDPGETSPLALSGPDYDRLVSRMDQVFP